MRKSKAERRPLMPQREKGRWAFFMSIGVSLWLLCTAAVHAEAPAEPPIKNPFANSQAAVLIGQDLYSAKCASRCHASEAGWSRGKYPDLLDCVWRYGGSDAEFFRTVMEGIPKTEMLGWEGKLSDDAVWQVLTYLRAKAACEYGAPTTSVQAKPVPAIAKTQTRTENQVTSENLFAGDAAAIMLGRLAFRGQCTAECHPGAGAWTGGKYPDLFDCEWLHGGSDAEIFRTVTSGVPKTEMLSFQGKLTDDVIWKIIAYLRSASLCKEGVPAPAPTH